MPRIASALLLYGLVTAVPEPLAAQVTFDGTLGPPGPAPTRTDLPGFDLDTLIRYDEGDASPQGLRVGGNLFHSLSDLGIPQPSGQRTSATFQAFGSDGQPLVLQNVIARITGGRTSVIEGVLRSEIPGADLYLINPSGVIFRGDASGATLENQLDVPANLFVTTADALRFEDGTSFRVADPIPTVSLDVPSHFDFLGGAAAQVALHDRALLVPAAGTTLTIVAGGVSLDGESRIDFEGGSTRIAAVGGAAVAVPVDVESFAARGAAPGSLGTIALEMDSSIRPVSDFADGPQGRVVLRGGRLVVDDSLVEGGGESEPGHEGIAGNALDVEFADEVIAANDARLQVRSAASVGAGSGRVVTRRLEVRDDGTRVGVRTAGDATAAPFVVEADQVLVEDGGQLLTENNGSVMPGGVLDIRAGRLEVRDGGRLVTATVFTSTDGGAVFVDAEEIVVTRSEGGAIPGAIESVSIFGGRGGDLSLDANFVQVDSGGQIHAFAGATSEGGDVHVTGGRLSIASGGQVRTNTSTDQAAGNVTVDVDGPVSIIGDGPDPDVPSGIFARSGTAPGDAGSGHAGNVAIDAASLAMTGNAVISTRSFGSGAAGAVAVNLQGDLALSNRAEISARTNDADSGGVDISAARVSLASGSAISSTTLGTGDGGNIVIDAGEVLLSGSGTEILSQSSEPLGANAGDAGTIQIRASRSVSVLDGARVSVASRGAGAAGDILVSSGEEVLLRNGVISTEAISQINTASGGSIGVTAGELVELVDSSLRTSVRGRVGAGDAGDVSIAAPFVVLNRSEVLAQAIAGTGGDITIVAGSFLQSADSLVSASSELGIDGVVSVRAPDTDLKGDLARLPAAFQDAAGLLREHCAARVAGRGSFVVAGSEGTRAAPDGPLSAPVPLPDDDELPSGAAVPLGREDEPELWLATIDCRALVERGDAEPPQ